ncbi:cysteine-rich secretory protein LCCL domain-containing 2-like [Folsomia candida]|uniref:cysteine-rich secretory protein LCCL domain-containing 2-like n=1 Tax=Folsomia candida TaxID=158441 RepID=UPI0016054AA9|nr:cysteine-rich secretory protein LCCL domain-containing 2-like [Folsomia candida]
MSTHPPDELFNPTETEQKLDLDSQNLAWITQIRYENLTGSPPTEWLKEIVRFHNVLRKRHGSQKVEFDYEIAYEAHLWALELAKKAIKKRKIILENGLPNNNKKLGENLGARQSKMRLQLLDLPGSFPVRVWYSEIRKHDWEKNYWQWDSGHFTQLIWGATKRIGCGRVVTEELCESGKIVLPSIFFVVCRYWPAGNWLHKHAYEEHVHPPKDGKSHNEIPDFTKYCPIKSKPCSRPVLCCPTGKTRSEFNGSSSCEITPKKIVGRGFKKLTTPIPTTTSTPIPPTPAPPPPPPVRRVHFEPPKRGRAIRHK